MNTEIDAEKYYDDQEALAKKTKTDWSVSQVKKFSDHKSFPSGFAKLIYLCMCLNKNNSCSFIYLHFDSMMSAVTFPTISFIAFHNTNRKYYVVLCCILFTSQALYLFGVCYVQFHKDAIGKSMNQSIIPHSTPIQSRLGSLSHLDGKPLRSFPRIIAIK